MQTRVFFQVGTRPQRYEEFYSGTVRYGIFEKSRYTGIFRYGNSLLFSSHDFLEIVRFSFIGAIRDQFREFPQLLWLVYIQGVFFLTGTPLKVKV